MAVEIALPRPKQIRTMMLDGYNDYVNMTKGYLRNYNKFLVTIDNLADEINAEQEFVDKMWNVSAAIAKYGDEPSGGYNELTVVESAAEKRMISQRKLIRMRAEVKQLRIRLDKIDRAMALLKKEDREIIREYVIEGRTAIDVGNDHFCSDSWVRRHSREIIKDIALMIFGVKAIPEQTRFNLIRQKSSTS